MSLDWSVERMKNYDVLTTIVVNQGTDESGPIQRKWLPLTEALVWATMEVGINQITESNWQEFYSRLNMWEGMLGPKLQVWGPNVPKGYKRFITPLEVYMHIGLSSNASPLTRAEFVKKVFTIFQRENKDVLNEVPAKYIGNGLEHMAEDEYQALWHDGETYTLDEKLAKLPSPLVTDENIGSI